MITGIGLDVTELDRIARLDEKSEAFRNRVLTEPELTRYEQLTARRQIEYLAGRFAAKEAFSKALGTGIGRVCSFQDIAILTNTQGAPTLQFKGEQVDGFVTITHTRTVAAAQVILQNSQHL